MGEGTPISHQRRLLPRRAGLFGAAALGLAATLTQPSFELYTSAEELQRHRAAAIYPEQCVDPRHDVAPEVSLSTVQVNGRILVFPDQEDGWNAAYEGYYNDMYKQLLDGQEEFFQPYIKSSFTVDMKPEPIIMDQPLAAYSHAQVGAMLNEAYLKIPQDEPKEDGAFINVYVVAHNRNLHANGLDGMGFTPLSIFSAAHGVILLPGFLFYASYPKERAVAHEFAHSLLRPTSHNWNTIGDDRQSILQGDTNLYYANNKKIVTQSDVEELSCE